MAKIERTAVSFQFAREWFVKSQKAAANSGKSDSAALWRDGLEHLDNLKAKNEILVTAARAVIDSAARRGNKGEYDAPWKELTALTKAVRAAEVE